MFRRDKPAAPVVIKKQLTAGILAVARRHHNECREIFGTRSEAITEPGTKAWATGNLRTRKLESNPGRVVDRLGVHRIDDANIVSDLPRVA